MSVLACAGFARHGVENAVRALVLLTRGRIGRAPAATYSVT